ncbi:MAG: pyruvate dehydrogenase complex dihydrolipoamide acetyltransferase [Verrucomicrobiota bacterium]
MANIIDMPKLSDTMTVGTLVKWLKKEGDAVKSGDMLAEVETDKATMELESFFEGTLLKIFAPGGSQVAIGSALCAIGKPGETVAAPAPKAAPAAPAAPSAKPQSSKSPAAPSIAPSAGRPLPSAVPAPRAEGTRLRISPLARKLAAEQGIDPASVAGSGPHGRIVRADILAAAQSPATAPAATHRAPPANFAAPAAIVSLPAVAPIQEEKLVPVSNMRATIARRLVESKATIPHFYLDIEIDAAPLLELRARLNASLEKEAAPAKPGAPASTPADKLSVNDFILKAAADALRAVPAMNCSWAGNAIHHHPGVHVSFAVAIEDGLITPVIRDTHTKNLVAISRETKDLAKRAKEKKLKPEEFTGGTFCVTNLGMMGVDRFCAIINPPNAGILAVGATVKKPVVKGDALAIGQRMTLTLSGDHRVVDGATGAQFLSALRDLLEKPTLMLL